jgi:predicted SAM-dependent methyltransferase
MTSATKKFIRNNLPFVIPPIKSAIGVVRQLQSKNRIRNLLKGRGEIFLELGAGEKKGKGKWITIDMTKSCDLFWDLRKGLPFPDDSINKIYSSHFFEHLSFKEAQKMLDECLRVLVPGGSFSICVPNARIYIEAYLGQRSLDKKQFFSGWKPAYNNTTKIDYVNYVAHLDGHHKYMFDEENLLHILSSKGFTKVRLREFDPTLDRKVRAHESIYAEGRKR